MIQKNLLILSFPAFIKSKDSGADAIDRLQSIGSIGLKNQSPYPKRTTGRKDFNSHLEGLHFQR